MGRVARTVSRPALRLSLVLAALTGCDFVRNNEPIAPRLELPVVQVVVVAGADRVSAVVDDRPGHVEARSLAFSRAGGPASSFVPLPPGQCGDVAIPDPGRTSCVAVDLPDPISEGEQVALSGSTEEGEPISGTSQVPRRPRLGPGSSDTIRIHTTKAFPLPRGRAELAWTPGPRSAGTMISIVDARVAGADGATVPGCDLSFSPNEDDLIEGGEIELSLALPSTLCSDAATVSGELILASVDSAFAAFHLAVREGADRLPFAAFGLTGAHGVFGSLAPRRVPLSWTISDPSGAGAGSSRP